MTKLTIRRMELADIDGVLEVEKSSFSTPWTRETFKEEITHNSYAHYYVVEHNEKIVAYAGMWMILDETQITNIAVLPSYRGLKIGERLFAHMLSIAIRLGTVHLSLEVRESNRVAQNLYRKFGLVPGGVRKRYYVDNQEDAIVMWVNFNESK